MPKIKLSKSFIRSTCKRALNEDLYPIGDITSNLINKIIVEDINLRTLYSWKLVRSFLNQDIYIKLNFL